MEEELCWVYVCTRAIGVDFSQLTKSLHDKSNQQVRRGKKQSDQPWTRFFSTSVATQQQLRRFVLGPNDKEELGRHTHTHTHNQRHCPFSELSCALKLARGKREASLGPDINQLGTKAARNGGREEGGASEIYLGLCCALCVKRRE